MLFFCSGVQSRAASTIKGPHLHLPDLGSMTFSSSLPSDPVEKDPTVSDILGDVCALIYCGLCYT